MKTENGRSSTVGSLRLLEFVLSLLDSSGFLELNFPFFGRKTNLAEVTDRFRR